jgi:hypothetical protein
MLAHITSPDEAKRHDLLWSFIPTVSYNVTRHRREEIDATPSASSYLWGLDSMLTSNTSLLDLSQRLLRAGHADRALPALLQADGEIAERVLADQLGQLLPAADMTADDGSPPFEVARRLVK